MEAVGLNARRHCTDQGRFGALFRGVANDTTRAMAEGVDIASNFRSGWGTGYADHALAHG
jgi:hypothetical protein